MQRLLGGWSCDKCTAAGYLMCINGCSGYVNVGYYF